MARPPLDWSVVPGTRREQVARARELIGRRQNPVAIKRAGAKWGVYALGHLLGFVPTKGAARGAAHFIGSYKLELGDFVHAYTEGY